MGKDKKLKKTEASEKLKVKEKKRVSGEQVVTHKDLNRVLGDSDLDPENNPEIDNSNDEDFNPCKKVPRQNRQDLRNFATFCDRYGARSRARGAIANAALVDAGVTNIEDQTNVIDKNKLRRAIDRFREEVKVADQESLVEAQGEAYYFDGKKDITLTVGKDDNGKYFNFYQEEEQHQC